MIDHETRQRLDDALHNAERDIGEIHAALSRRRVVPDAQLDEAISRTGATLQKIRAARRAMAALPQLSPALQKMSVGLREAMKHFNPTPHSSRG